LLCQSTVIKQNEAYIPISNQFRSVGNKPTELIKGNNSQMEDNDLLKNSMCLVHQLMPLVFRDENFVSSRSAAVKQTYVLYFQHLLAYNLK
jgi:hypothetical protein